MIVSGTGSEVVFTLRRQPGTSDADFERDADTVAADLARLKELLESAGEGAPAFGVPNASGSRRPGSGSH